MIALRINILTIIILNASYLLGLENDTNQQTNLIPIPTAIRLLPVRDNSENAQKKYIHGMPEDEYLAWLEKNPPTQLSRQQRETILTISRKYGLPLDDAYDIFVTIVEEAHKASIKGTNKKSKKAANKKRTVYAKHSTTALPEKTIKKNK